MLGYCWAHKMCKHYDVTVTSYRNELKLFGVKVINLNILEQDTVAAVIKEVMPDLIIHTVALASVDECERNPKMAYQLNAVAARTVALACARLRIKLMHVSTDHLFNGLVPMLTEEATVEPINIYARTKAQAEVMVQDVNHSALIIRTNFFGWGKSGKKSFSDRILEMLYSSRRIALFKDAYFSPIIMEYLIQASHVLIDKGESGIYHVVGNERLSKFDFGTRLCHAFGLDQSLVSPSFMKQRNDLTIRPKDTSLDNGRLRSVIPGFIGDLDSQFKCLMNSRVNDE